MIEENFVDPDGQTLDSSLWADSQPNGKGLEKCTKYKEGKLRDSNCESKGYACCKLPPYSEFTLRGIPSWLHVTQQYVWLDKEHVFQGVGEHSLIPNGSVWQIKNKMSDETVLSLNQTEVVGKKTWNTIDPKINIILSFDQCTDNEFNCNDGSCIKIEKRCDYKSDCNDDSDEHHCMLVELPHSYDKTEIPGGANVDEPLILNITNMKIHIVDIVDTQSYIQVMLYMHTKWTDSLLKFNNLKSSNLSNIDILTPREFKRIWIPTYSCSNLVGPLSQDLGAKYVSVEPRVSGIHSGAKDPDVDVEFLGSNVELTVHNILKAKFICMFENLSDFPIDTNTCNFSLYLHGSVAAWNIPTRDVKFLLPEEIKTNPKQMYMYQITGANVYVSSLSMVKISITLKRSFHGEFLRTSLPTLLLSIITFLSNMYYKKMPETAITANITCLLAMSGFYIAIGQNLTQTPVMKIIDIMQLKWLTCAVLLTILQIIVLTCKSETNKPNTVCNEGWMENKQKKKIVLTVFEKNISLTMIEKNIILTMMELIICPLLPMFEIITTLVYLCMGMQYDLN